MISKLATEVELGKLRIREYAVELTERQGNRVLSHVIHWTGI